MIYVFGGAEAAALAAEVGATYISRLTNDLESLRLLVRYGVVEPTVVVVTGAKGVVRLRVPRLLTAEALRRDLAALD